MKTSSVKFGNDNSPIHAFKPYGLKHKEGKIPGIISRNYIDSLPMKQSPQYDASQSWYRYTTLNNGNKRLIKANSIQVSMNTMVNKMMKSDLLSSHFDLGKDNNPQHSESQSNFYKKKSEANLLTLTRNKIKNKVEK